jgi:hypothetical protein
MVPAFGHIAVARAAENPENPIEIRDFGVDEVQQRSGLSLQV